MSGIPGTSKLAAISSDAATMFEIGMRAWGWFEQIRAKLRARRAAGEQLTPEEQAAVDMTDEDAFAELRSASQRLIDHAIAVEQKHTPKEGEQPQG